MLARHVAKRAKSNPMGRTSLEDAIRLLRLPRDSHCLDVPLDTRCLEGPWPATAQRFKGKMGFFAGSGSAGRRVGWRRQPDGDYELRRRPNDAGCRAFCASARGWCRRRKRRRRRPVAGSFGATCSMTESEIGGRCGLSTGWRGLGFGLRYEAVCGRCARCPGSGPELPPGMDAGPGWLLRRCLGPVWSLEALQERQGARLLLLALLWPGLRG